MDKLRTYFNSLSVAEREDFARRCHTTVGYLRKLCSTNIPMGEGLCLRLAVESGFVLQPEDMLPDVDWAQLRSALLARQKATGRANKLTAALGSRQVPA